MNIEKKSVGQTPVEWLIDEWLHLDAEFDMVLIDKKTYWEKLREKQNQAKEMEKNLVCDSWDDGYGKGLRTREEKITDPVFNSKHYYDTNYKKEEQ